MRKGKKPKLRLKKNKTRLNSNIIMAINTVMDTVMDMVIIDTMVDITNKA